MGCGRDIIPVGGSALAAEFFAVDALPELAYDHGDIISYAHDRLKAKLTYTNAIFAFLPRTFTLTELQSAYEAVLGRELDKRNFRKKFLSLDLITETDEMKREGAHRPARLYRFNTPSLEALSRSFD
jgi:8-oxo-dGTP diphosphatase